MRPLPLALAAAISATLVVRPVEAQQRYQTLGPNECVNCHDHQTERQWYEKLEIPEVRKLFPEKGANAGHINSLKQLETPKSNEYAKAIGLKDKYQLDGACVKCHATVFAGDANAGVSCESCHGPSSGYVKVHQTKGAYEQSLKVGMTPLIGNLQAWAQQCTGCHVMDNPALIAAGHPDGNDFDLGKKYVPVSLHFKKKYSAADLTTIGRGQVQALIAKRGGGAAAPAAAPVAPAPVAIAPAAPSPAPVAVAPPPPAPPVPAPVPPPPAMPPAAPPVAAVPPAVSLPPGAVPPPPAASAVPAAPPARSLAASGLPASLPAAVALLQGRLIAVLTELLQRGEAAPVRWSTPAPVLAPYAGPDAELLQLQREAIALALEALGSAPADPAAPPRP